MNEKYLSNSKTILEHIKCCEDDFIQLVRKRLGIAIQYHQTNDLYKTVTSACHKFNCSVIDYLQALNECPYDSPLLEHLVYGITVGETYFFRDQHQMQLLQENLLPELIRQKRKRGDLSLRIWSAACASGEEIYTIMMILSELIPDLKSWTLQLMGTDINTNSLKKAINGHYNEWSMRSISDYFKRKYFSKEEHLYLLSAEIRQYVSFSYLNLNDNSYPSIFNGTNAQDLILCCNVLIYFDSEYIPPLMKKLETSLVPGGYLLLGASDPSVLINTNLIFHHQQGVYYSRPTDEVIQRAKVTIANQDPLLTPKVIAPMIKKIPPSMASHPLKPSISMDPTRITTLINESRWIDALTIIKASLAQGSKTVFLLNAMATVLANLGDLAQAATCCQESLVLDETNKHTYFMYSLILIEQNQLTTAEELLRKTLFLDHQFVEGHFQLGLLLLRNKKAEAGIKSLRNALAIAQRKDPAQLVSELKGLDFGHLADILKHDIELYIASQGLNNGKESNNKEASR